MERLLIQLHSTRIQEQHILEILGSDCHGLNHRVPNLKNGREALEKMMGSTFIDKMDKEAAVLLGLEDK